MVHQWKIDKDRLRGDYMLIEEKNKYAQNEHIKKLEKSSNEIKNGEKTPNQVRKEHGLPPIEGGGIYLHKVIK